MILTRIPQRSQNDCSFCSVAMVLNCTYEQVKADRAQYFYLDDKTEWWQCYLINKGFNVDYLPLTNLDILQVPGGTKVGLLVMENRTLQAAHIVAIDELGVLDPSDGFPDHVDWDLYVQLKQFQGFALDAEFLLVSSVK